MQDISYSQTIQNQLSISNQNFRTNLLTFVFVCLFALGVSHRSTACSTSCVNLHNKRHIYEVVGFLVLFCLKLTCCCAEAESEGKVWDDRLRGGGCGGGSRLGGALVWDGCDATGIRGSCILSTGGGWGTGWAGAAWGLSGSGSNGEPASRFAALFTVKKCFRNLKNSMNENTWMWKHQRELQKSKCSWQVDCKSSTAQCITSKKNVTIHRKQSQKPHHS